MFTEGVIIVFFMARIFYDFQCSKQVGVSRVACFRTAGFLDL